MNRLMSWLLHYAHNLYNGLKVILNRIGLISRYPKNLIPLEGWNNDIKADKILAVEEHSCIGRRFHGKISAYVEDGLDGNPVLKETALAIDDIPGLSTCLLNTRFPYECFQYHQIGNGKNPWISGVVDLSEFTEGNDYKIVEEYCVIGWKIRNLHDKRIPYVRHFNKKKDFDSLVEKASLFDKDSADKRDVEEIERICALSYEQLALEAKNCKRTLDTKASVVVKHAPNNLNYWHFTVDYYPVEDKGKPINGTKGWKNMIAVHVRDILKKTGIPVSTSHPCFGVDYTSVLTGDLKEQ